MKNAEVIRLIPGERIRVMQHNKEYDIEGPVFVVVVNEEWCHWCSVRDEQSQKNE